MFKGTTVKDISDIVQKEHKSEGDKGIDKVRLENELMQVAKKNWKQLYDIQMGSVKKMMIGLALVAGGSGLSMYSMHEYENKSIPLAATAVGLALAGFIYNQYLRIKTKKQQFNVFVENSEYLKSIIESGKK